MVEIYEHTHFFKYIGVERTEQKLSAVGVYTIFGFENVFVGYFSKIESGNLSQRGLDLTYKGEICL